jgi:DNA-binding response OmpR family regulator
LLVVDDDRQVREFTRKALQEAGYTVLVATDGNEALELIANAANELNLVITDLIMPKCSGAQILSLIRAKYQQIRTLLVTGCGAELLPGDLVGDGACVLNKPYTREELLTATRKVLTAS